MEYQGNPIIRSHNDLTDIGLNSHSQIDALLNVNLVSNPPIGCKKVINIYYDRNVGEVIMDIES